MLRARAVLGGWRRADFILCLGSWELAWMTRRFPHWSGKLGFYVCAPSPGDRKALADVRRRRSSGPPSPGTRFLWIGRWSQHKGTRRLLHFLAERLHTHPGGFLHDRRVRPGRGPGDPAGDLPDRKGPLNPFVPQIRPPSLLEAHEAGLFTSDVEGWGLSLSEMLESGLTVYATEAGAVADLRPFWGSRLQPFPPAADRFAPGAAGEPDLDGYLARFSWPAIARHYEEVALG